MNLQTSFVIYLYMIACLVLMAFNFGYILYHKRVSKRNEKNHSDWDGELETQFARIQKGFTVEPRHEVLLAKKLRRTSVFIRYVQALERKKVKQPEVVSAYGAACYQVYQRLAFVYGKRESMERAFFADFISRFPPYTGEEHKAVMDVLVGYLHRSTVYCRENTIRALCAMGNTRAVVNALQIFNDREHFHHQKLLTDALSAFAGDRKALAAALWDRYKVWNSNLMLSAVQFIANVSPEYQETFLPVLKDSTADLELRLAVMRYYRKFPYEPVRDLLLSFLSVREAATEELAIVAASALDHYPGDATVHVLKMALGDANWYIRSNAARSLMVLEVSNESLEDVLDGTDAYAKEILVYHLEQTGRGNGGERAGNHV